MIRLSLILAMAFLLGCTNDGTIQKEPGTTTRTVQQPSNAIEALPVPEEKVDQVPQEISIESANTPTITVDSITLYSAQFLDGIKALDNLESAQLEGGMMILNQKDTVQFPTIPQLHKQTIFTGKKDELAIALTTERTNYTSIKYRLEIVAFGKSSQTIEGIAHLAPLFFLGSETDTDDLSNESYLSTSFSNQEDACYTEIRIGNTQDSNDSPLLAKLIRHCDGVKMDVDLANFPVLREK